MKVFTLRSTISLVGLRTLSWSLFIKFDVHRTWEDLI